MIHPHLLDFKPSLASPGATWIALFLSVYALAWALRRRDLDHIPSIGYSGVLTSWIGAALSVVQLEKITQEGYKKYGGRPFKVSTLTGWVVVVAGPQYVEDIRKAPEEVLSLAAAADEMLQLEHTMGPTILESQYHTEVIKNPLTRNLATNFGDLYDEISLTIPSFIPTGDEWVKLPAYKTVMAITNRTVNRLFVGQPLCRDPNLAAANESFTLAVIKLSTILRFFPKNVRWLVARVISDVESNLQKVIKHLGPNIQERLDMKAKYGEDWPDKPLDLLSWLIDESPEHLRNVRDLSLRCLVVNFAAMHTTSMGWTHLLFNLAVYPEYIEALREEADTVIRAEGWSKAAMARLRKLDSFLKESLRHSSGFLTMERGVIQPLTLSDGTTLPAGSSVAVAVKCMHMDEQYYPNPETFNGFRFLDSKLSEHSRQQVVALSLDWIMFGSGRHACPGRFLAVNEIKALTAYTILNYDIKLASATRPADLHLGSTSLPNQTADIWFRKRKYDNRQ
ncbi:cytochrome P450 [Pluteus cervinus]|uniref:Cytochrome P450 n=1 Tax=Pluteus cervinus TaxID=181527 RepID=A0ACD3B4R1_9AGAR|nr:cytochrome P450 [Pluteus cervinus]